MGEETTNHAEGRNDHSGNHRADEARDLKERGIKRNGGRKIFARNNGWHNGMARCLMEGIDKPRPEREQDQERDVEHAREHEGEKQCVLDEEQSLRPAHNIEGRLAISQSACKGREHPHRGKISSRNNSQHQGRMGEFPSQPANAHALHPGGHIGRTTAADKPRIIAMGKDAGEGQGH